MARKPTFTQHNVAFPQVALHRPWHLDEVLLHGRRDRWEVRLTFMEFAKGGGRAVEVAVFSDQFVAFNDTDFTRVIEWMRKLRPAARSNLTPEKVVEKLRLFGWAPSHYHANGEKTDPEIRAELLAFGREATERSGR